MGKTPYICVFGAASEPEDPQVIQVAKDFGQDIGEQGLGLVYAGGKMGARGACALAAHEAGAKLVVVQRSELPVDESILGSSVFTEHNFFKRLETFIDMKSVSAFAVLPGGVEVLMQASVALNLAVNEVLDGRRVPVLLPEDLPHMDGLRTYFETAVMREYDPKASLQVLKPWKQGDDLRTLIGLPEPTVD